MQERKRLTGPDVVRCVALLFIIGVHFFYNNGFYQRKQLGLEMLVADIVRWLTFSCVPMFIILTGYLKANAKLSLNFYKGIVSIIVTWIVVSFICILFKEFYVGKNNTVFRWLVEFLNYQGADYSWYIELYIGLFLLIPFLNGFFGWENDRKYHIILLITMVITAFVPSIVNGATINGEVVDIMPNYFVSMWPFAYYFIGCFLRKYEVKINAWLCLAIAVAFSVVKGIMSFTSAYKTTFYKGIGGGYSDFFVAVITVFVFMACYRVEIKNERLKKLFAHVSQRALHVYLLSSIADALANDCLGRYNAPSEYWWTFPVRCFAVFLASLAMAEVVYPITNWISAKIVGLFDKKKVAE